MSEKRRCYQFRLRTLLGLVALTAVGLGGWQYWERYREATRHMRELDQALPEDWTLAPAEATLFRKLAWNRPAWQSGLIEDLGLNRPDLLPALRKTIQWSGEFTHADGCTYLVL